MPPPPYCSGGEIFEMDGESGISSPPLRPFCDLTLSSAEGEGRRFRAASLAPVHCDVGVCSLLGPRSNNEDRCVAVNDLFHEVSQDLAPGHTHQFYGSDRGAGWRELANPRRTCGLKSPRDSFFAVYDGHSGVHASSYLQTTLHRSLYTYVFISSPHS